MTLLALGLGLQFARAQPIEDTFRGKTVKIVLPVPSAGGDRALYTLAFAPFFARHIPGNPSIQPVFMGGAGGSAAVNYVYNVAAQDGLTLVTPLTGVVMTQALGDESVRYDVSRMHWIGRTSDATRIFFVSSKVGARVLDDFRRKEVVIGAVSRASETFSNPAFINKVFGTKFKIVSGYQSASKAILAFDVGETEGIFTTWVDVSTFHSEWLTNGKIRLILQIGLTKNPTLPDLPLLLDLAENDADRQLVTFMASGSQMGQSFAAPPGTPPAVVAALRRAFEDTMKDPGFIEKMRASRLQFNPMSGERLAQAVVRTLGAPKTVIARYKAAVAGD